MTATATLEQRRIADFGARSRRQLSAARAVDAQGHRAQRSADRGPDPQVPVGHRLRERPRDFRQPLPADGDSRGSLHRAAAAARDCADRRRDARRPRLSADRRRPRPSAAGAARVCLRRPGAGAAGGLRQLGARPDDCVRAAAKAAARKGVLRHPRRAGDAQPAWPRDQRRQGHVHLRPAGQRQDDHRPANHPLLRPEHSHSARDRRRRQDHQDVRCLVPPGGSHGDRKPVSHRGVRSPLDSHRAADGGRRRRADDGQPRAQARSGLERERGVAAAEEQLRLPA